MHNWVLFAHTLRSIGIATSAARVHEVISALEAIDIGHRSDVRDAARTILVSRPDQVPLFDQSFDRFWRADLAAQRHRLNLGRKQRRSSRTGVERKSAQGALPTQGAGKNVAGTSPESPANQPPTEALFSWSAREALWRKDFADLDATELTAVRALLRTTILPLPHRRTRRRFSASSGTHPDLRRSIRDSVRTGGESLPLRWRRQRCKTRPFVILCDISGSMAPYARIFLQFLYALGARAGRTEVFVFGTRLTRITRELAHRDVDQALKRATAAVVDWGGGTRIGEVLKRFNYDWARRVLGQGAIAAVISDGWDRGDVALLRREAARLGRTSDRLMWLNPLIGSPGYEPLTQGIRAILPLVDDFMPIHNLQSLEQLGHHLQALRSERPAPVRPQYLRRAHTR